MSRKRVARAAVAWVVMATSAAACGRQPLLLPASPDAGSRSDSGGGGGGGGSLRLPDGGISALFRDGGFWAGILDAPRDSLLGQVLCGPEARLGARCSSAIPICLLPSLGGLCMCVDGTYVCPLDPSRGPTECPPSAASGGVCFSPLSVCIGGGANLCMCGVGTYNCL